MPCRLRETPVEHDSQVAALDEGVGQGALHEGDVITVCGTVVSAKWSAKSGNTYLNLDKKFPNQIFSVTIFKDHRKRKILTWLCYPEIGFNIKSV